MDILGGLFSLGAKSVPGYEVGDQIAEGAFSTVHRARSTSDVKTAAVKITNKKGTRLYRILEKDPNALWEGELMSSLSHPNIAEVYDYGKAGGRYWVAMELVDVKTGNYLKPPRTEAAVRERLDILIQVAQALSHVHEKGFLHRDMCLGNVLIGPNKQVKLVDFGIALPINHSPVRDSKAGTPSYMAPEVIREGITNIRSDVYSCGVVMYELMTGNKPFKAADKYQRMLKNLSTPPLPPSRYSPHISPQIDAVILKAIEKNPGDRYENMQDLCYALISTAITEGTVVYWMRGSVEDGAAVTGDEVSLMAWANSPSGVKHVQFQYSRHGKKWHNLGDPVPARPGRENVFGMDWDLRRVKRGIKVLLRAVALDGEGEEETSDAITITLKE